MNKAILAVVGVWLIALTYIQLKPTPRFSSDSDAPIIAYVHGDSLHSGMNLISELEATLQANVEEVDSLLKAEATPLQQEAQELIAYANITETRSLFHKLPYKSNLTIKQAIYSSRV